MAKLLGISVDGCGPDGCAVVAFSHAAIDAPLAKSAPDIANAVSILRVLKRDTSVTCSLFVKRASFVTAVTTSVVVPIEYAYLPLIVVTRCKPSSSPSAE